MYNNDLNSYYSKIDEYLINRTKLEIRIKLYHSEKLCNIYVKNTHINIMRFI